MEPHALHGVFRRPAYFHADIIHTQGQAGIQKMAFLVGLDLIISLDVGASDLNHGALNGLAVFALHVAFHDGGLCQHAEGAHQHPSQR